MLFEFFMLPAALVTISTGAEAQTDASIHSGFLYPFLGLELFFVVVGVGIWASSIGGKAIWKMPLGFLFLMVFGGIIGIGAANLPRFALIILPSVVVVAGLWIFRIKMSDWIAAAVAGFSAILQGYSHGMEMPIDVSPVCHSLELILATGILYALGVYLGHPGDSQIAD